MSIVHRIWRDEPGRYFFLSSKDRSGNWADHPFKRSALRDIDAFVEANLDKDLYFCPHGLSKHRRLKRYAEPGHWYWADLDEADPRKNERLLPTVAWESSPGRYAALWRVSDLMTEDVNRRLTYALGADPGGWDMTQVLRLPGTTNFKYTSTPKVKLLWSDGPEYTTREIIKKLPPVRTAVVGDRTIALGLYRKYESRLPGWLRRTIWNKASVKPGKRSEVLWKLNNTLREVGATSDEIFEMLRVSPWNKFVKRRDADEQLRREIDKGITQHMRVVDDETGREEVEGDGDDPDVVTDDDAPYQFLAKPMSEVEEEKLDWVWYPYLARGELTILEGDPGLGKSYLAQMVSAAICDGEKLPCVKPKVGAVKGKVAYFDIENAAGTVTKKRLVGNGMQNLKDFYQEMEPFSVEDDDSLDLVYDAIERLKPTLVVFDTLNTYMGGADVHNSAEVQQTFKKFVEIARRHKCAVMVLRHLTKSSKGVTALYRGQGSISFAGLARVVMTIGTDPKDPDTRVMAVTKLNVARVPKALTFTITEVPSLKEDDRSKFLWGEFVDLTADEIVSREPGKHDDELEDTCTWLKEALADGPVNYDAISRMAEPRGVSELTLRRAAATLKIDRTKTRDGIVWSLPIGGAPSEAEES